MNEYKKKLAAQTAGKVNSESAPEMTNGIPNSVLNDVFAGKKNPTSEMMGHKMPLPPSIAAKMQQSFGMDLTQLSVYQSDAMAGTGMKGVSQGNKVVLSSDIDLNTGEGQAVLGHELSHIHAQSQGTGTGHSGLYNNAALEAQADREGIMAAHGRPIYDHGMTGNPGMSYGLGMRGVEGLTPLSGGISASAGAPMQAKKDSSNKATEEMGDISGKAIQGGDLLKFRPGTGKMTLNSSADTVKLDKLNKENNKVDYWKKIVGKGRGSASQRVENLAMLEEIVKGAREKGEDPVAALEGTDWLTGKENEVLKNKDDYWKDLKGRYNYGQQDAGGEQGNIAPPLQNNQDVGEKLSPFQKIRMLNQKNEDDYDTKETHIKYGKAKFIIGPHYDNENLTEEKYKYIEKLVQEVWNE